MKPNRLTSLCSCRAIRAIPTSRKNNGYLENIARWCESTQADSLGSVRALSDAFWAIDDGTGESPFPLDKLCKKPRVEPRVETVGTLSSGYDFYECTTFSVDV